MVFVLDKHKKPLMPCSEKRARLLLQKGRAVIHRMAPFTIRLKGRLVGGSRLQPLRLKIKPGAEETGVAVLREETPDKSKVIMLLQIRHKPGVKRRMDSRRALRRSRRNRKTRYRQPRFLNRRRPKGWLPPSLEARVNQTVNTIKRLTNLLPLTALSTEHAKFDTQLLQNPDISSMEYQQGELFGYEVREYLLEKWGRKCAYCDKTGVPLEIEHIVPKARGGTNRVSNLALACHDCNQEKGILTAKEFGHPEVQTKGKRPMKEEAMLNATRWRLYEQLNQTGLLLECGTAARTKKQRIEHELPKTKYHEACCVGKSTPETLEIAERYVQVWSAKGRGTRKMCNTDKNGFPISHRSRQKQYFGFQTGDLVVAKIPKGKYAGFHVGRVAVRASGYFDIKTGSGKRTCQGISHKYFRVLQRAGGWQYEKKEEKAGNSSHG